jgi:hypothetical protein
MAEADVESDSAVLASMAGVLSEDKDDTHKQKQTNKSGTKKNTKGGRKGKEVKRNLKSQKGVTGSDDNSMGVSPTMGDPHLTQERGSISHEVEDNSNTRGNFPQGIANQKGSSPKPGCSRGDYDGDSSPIRNPWLSHREGTRYNNTDRGNNDINGAVGQGDDVYYPYKTQTQDTRTGSSRDCGGAQSLSDRLSAGRPSRARGSEEADEGGRRRRADAIHSDDRQHGAAVGTFSSTDDDRPTDGRNVGRRHYCQRKSDRV